MSLDDKHQQRPEEMRDHHRCSLASDGIDSVDGSNGASQEDEQALEALSASYRRYLVPPPPPPRSLGSSSSATLTHPVLLPQAFPAPITQPPAPFVRAYPPIFRTPSIDIPCDLFLAILDALHLCRAPPLPLQALGLASRLAGFVPSHIAQGVSAGVGLAVGVGTAAVRITRQNRFLACVNQDVFTPRGLVMEVVKDEEVLARAGIHLAPLPLLDVEQTTESAESSESALTVPGAAQHMSRATQTRLAQLAPYSAPLSLNVPPPALPTGTMDRIAAKETAQRLKSKEENAQKRERKMQKAAGVAVSSSSDIGSSDSSDSDSEDAYYAAEAAINTEADAQRRAAEISGDHRAVAKTEKARAKQLEDLLTRQRKHQKRRDKKRDKQAQRQDKHVRKQEQKVHKRESKYAGKDQKDMSRLAWVVVRRI
ncbi:hypothetical protein SCUCBS95973_007874 [Sporothrix curviconia]|uniref:Uncharacterized protein n=1 Tax=Sporothrix curviconia TaxID=1260050 RepID=A0ABP0CIA6_9PEZI